MRLYGGKLLKQKTQKQLKQAQELRDAIVYDVTPASRYCRVLIQGSNTHIKAYYPENWEQTPNYLKPGNAVRITHPGGNRGRIEIAGNGILKPTDINSQVITITPSTLQDVILTGCSLTASKPASMSINISYGTYRIDEVTYTLSGMLMDRDDIVMDRYDLLMDEVGDSITFDAAGESTFRYDTICVGTDGVIDIVKGDAFLPRSAIPDPPDALADHLRLGWVLIPPNTTEITGGLINKYYTAPYASYLTVTLTPDEVPWEEGAVITVYVKDQYGNNITGNYTVIISWERGTGSISKGDITISEPNSFTFSFSGYSGTANYNRTTEIETEYSPSLFIQEANPTIGLASLHVQLLTIVGSKIP